MRAERLARVGGHLLEGPCWDARAGRLLLADIEGHELLALDWATRQLERTPSEHTPSAWIPRSGGGDAVASRPGLLLDGELAVPVEAGLPENRSNDAKCDPSGRMWFGTMHDDAAPGAAALYRIDADRSCHEVLGGVTISNGLGWSPDATRMYHVDTPTHRIDVLDYDLASGTATGRRALADVAHLDGMPDGLAVDAEGALWVAFHGGGAVHRFAPDGAHLATVRVPADRPTSCAFAGEDLTTLVVTTAGDGDADLYAFAPPGPGLPVGAFAG